MAARPELLAALADPSPESWARVWELLYQVRGTQLAEEVAACRRELREWPPEVDRPPRPARVGRRTVAEVEARAAAGTDDRLALLAPLCRTVREVDLYPLYVAGICESPRLRLSDGRQAVRLQRAFVGSLSSGRGDVRVGQRGQGDLVGGMCAEWWECPEGCRWATPPPAEFGADDLSRGDCCARHGESARHLVEVTLEVEVKRDGGRLRPDQAQRRDALRARGGVYVVARRIAEAVDLLVAERVRLARELGVARG